MFWAVLFVAGLAGIGVGIVFLLSSPEMTVLAVLFGVPGAFIAIESLDRMLRREK